MKKQLAFIPALLGLSLVFTSCGSGNGIESYSTHASITVNGKNSKGEGVIKPSDVTISETYHSIQDKRIYNTRVLPSTGDVNLLVIPILIPGYETINTFDAKTDNDKVIKDIDTAFFGKTEETGYESVSSFYYKSSYGKLNLQGTVTDWFDPTKYASGITNAASITLSRTYELVNEALTWATKYQNINLTDYDNDSDGYVDGVWFVYSAPDYSKNGPHTDDLNYWAYTSWTNQTTAGNTKKPVANLFGWASYDFMYESYGYSSLDSHTFIHETGHFLGLTDYYSDSGSYNPIGKVDMMDSNIIDHNSYSKMLLGWSKPYIVLNGETTIDLYTMENENSFIVIPADDFEITNGEFDPFGEYILIELYSNDGLNYKDSKVKLSSDRPLAMNSTGVRIYHIDSRKFLCDKTDTSAVTIKEYENETISTTKKIAIPMSNARGADVYNTVWHLDVKYNLYDEIRTIEKKGTDTFSSGGYQTDKSLFSEGSSFSLADFSAFFDGGVLDNGQKLTSTVKVDKIY
jgi:M6 family metalloprotease-like protein